MFGRKKEAAAAIDRAGALKMLDEALESMQDVRDGEFMKGVLFGAADMAFTLGAITFDERNNYKHKALAIDKDLKAKGKPQYKKKGVYEYNGYHILKDFAKDAGDGSACWCVRKIGADEMIAKDVTFKEAVAIVDKAARG